MNYRHSFHAGNHADVLKHVILCLVLGHLNGKRKPYFVLDTHGGRGIYDLSSTEALRSGEFLHGIRRLLDRPVPPEMDGYLSCIRAANPPGAILAYPGSPRIIAQALRRDDRLVACDLHAGEADQLSMALKSFRNARCEARDGYQALKALLPPPERRGLVLIDPPFERTDEFETLAASLKAAHRRWASGVYLVWYPLKRADAAEALSAALAEAGIADVTTYELFVRSPSESAGLAGSGVLAINASYTLDPAMATVLPWLSVALAQGPGASWAQRRIMPE